MKTKFNILKWRSNKQKQSSNKANKPVCLILKNQADLDELLQAVADAAAYTGYPYTEIIERSTF